MRTKILFTGFAPNLTLRDVRTSLSYLLFPWKWSRIKEGQYTALAEKTLASYFGENYSAVTYDSGRSALYAALKSLGVGEGDVVLVQAFTCVVVINAIKLTGATPEYVDIDETYNMDPTLLGKRLQSNTKAIIVQHTFGTPAQIESIIEIAKKHEIAVVEDCAHALGGRFQNKLLGTFGDIAMLSFGTDKVISCVRGGAIITKSQELLDVCQKIQKSLPPAPVKNILQELLYLPFFFIGKLTYGFIIGKWLLHAAKKIGITAKIIDDCEKQGIWPKHYPSKLPNALADILCDQIDDIDIVNEHRKKIAGRYHKEIKNDKIVKPIFNSISIGLRYPIQVENSKDFMLKAKQSGIILGDWYRNIVAPGDVNPQTTGYTEGSCPQAENAVKNIVNLPTERQLTMKDVDRIIDFCNS